MTIGRYIYNDTRSVQRFLQILQIILNKCNSRLGRTGGGWQRVWRFVIFSENSLKKYTWSKRFGETWTISFRRVTLILFYLVKIALFCCCSYCSSYCVLRPVSCHSGVSSSYSIKERQTPEYNYSLNWNSLFCCHCFVTLKPCLVWELNSIFKSF